MHIEVEWRVCLSFISTYSSGDQEYTYHVRVHIMVLSLMTAGILEWRIRAFVRRAGPAGVQRGFLHYCRIPLLDFVANGGLLQEYIVEIFHI